jgi:hypothetical protein
VGSIILELTLVLLGFAGILCHLLAFHAGEREGRREHTWSEVLPVKLPIADWTAPVAESTYDWRVEVFLSDMIAVEFVVWFVFCLMDASLVEVVDGLKEEEFLSPRRPLYTCGELSVNPGRPPASSLDWCR